MGINGLLKGLNDIYSLAQLERCFFRKLFDPVSANKVKEFIQNIPSIAGKPQVPQLLADLMLLAAVFNSCLNPIIYGRYYYRDFRTLASGTPLKKRSTHFSGLISYQLMISS